MPKVIRRDAVLLIVGTSYRKKTSAVWELEHQPKRDEGAVLYYEDFVPDERLYKRIHSR